MPDPPAEFSPVKAPAFIALGAGLLLSVLVTNAFWQSRERARQDEVQRIAQDRADVIRGQILRSMEVLHGMAAYFEAHPEVTREDFGNFVNGSLARQPELQALAWDPRVPGTDRGKWEEKARSEGFANFQFTQEKSEGVRTPAEAREIYYPVYFLESLTKTPPRSASM